MDAVACADDPGVEPKPSAATAVAMCAAWGVDPSRAVMVGDTSADIIVGRNAPMRLAVGVRSGVGSERDLRGAGADVVVDASQTDTVTAVREALGDDFTAEKVVYAVGGPYNGPAGECGHLLRPRCRLTQSVAAGQQPSKRASTC